MAKAQKFRAAKQKYLSPNQLILPEFETPFSKNLSSENRWVILAQRIPWDILVHTYQSQMGNTKTGADGINPRVAIGSMIIKHICDLSDRETVLQIQENMYMQYFLGYSSFSNEKPFDPSLFVDFRHRLGIDQINEINEKILRLDSKLKQHNQEANQEQKAEVDPPQEVKSDEFSGSSENDAATAITHKGELIVDATACPQDIAYPTDLNLLNDARKKAEELIDFLCEQRADLEKPRTYRKIARKEYLSVAQKKVKSKKQIRKAIGKQLNYLKRDLTHIDNLLDKYQLIPFDKHQLKYFMVIQHLYQQQLYMFKEYIHSVEHRIVSIHQPHVRPIVRGKTNANVEFGAKIHVSLMKGYAFLDELSWEAFNEGSYLMASVEKYKNRFGCYPAYVLADKIYCNRPNRAKLKELGIKLRAKPLGRPKAVDVEHVRPGERNPIEGKFGQAKTAYGMNRIKARLQQTSQSWIATIILVLNLVKLAREVPLWLKISWVTYSAQLYTFINIWLNGIGCADNTTKNYALMRLT